MAEDSAKAKEEWLSTLLKSEESRALVDRDAFLLVLRAIATSREPDASMRAEKWIRQLEQLSQRTDEKSRLRRHELEPDPDCYRMVIETWINSHHEDIKLSLVRAEKLLQKCPTTACCNAFLDLCTRGRGRKASPKLMEENAEKAQTVLETMIDDVRQKGKDQSLMAPDLDSFNFVIRGWTRARQSHSITERTQHALHLLEDYHKQFDRSVQPNVKSYSMFLDSISVQARHKVAMCAGYNKQNPDKNGLDEVEAIEANIKEMHRVELEGNADLAPNTHVYNTLISCWANLARLHENAPYEAEKVLQQMVDFKEAGHHSIAPDVFSYNIALRAWANSNLPNPSNRMSFLLNKLWTEYSLAQDERLRPNTETYNTVIRALAESNEPAQAEKRLQELMQHFEKDGKTAPNSESFIFVIRGWVALAKKGSKEALIRAVDWLDVLTKLEKSETGFQTTRELYEVILDACWRCSSVQPEVLDIAVETFDKLRLSHHSVHCLAFSRLLKTGLAALSRPENNHVRNAFVDELIKDCAEAGLVGKPVIRAISNGPVFLSGWTFEESAMLTARIFPQWPLPPSWSRNVWPKVLLAEESDLTREYFDECHPHRHGPGPARP